MENIVLKQIDILRDEIRWWMNIVLIVISSLVGGVFSISQNKIDLNFIVIGILLFLLATLIYSTLKLKELKNKIKINFKGIKRIKR